MQKTFTVDRISELSSKLRDNGLDAFLIRKMPNIRYITGFSGSAGAVLFTPEKKYFISDFRYKTQSSLEVDKSFEIVIYTQNSLAFLGELIAKHGIKKIGFESDFVTYSEATGLMKDFQNAEFVPMTNFVESLTVKKTPKEIELTRIAVEITDKVFSELIDFIKPGMTERQVAAQISYLHKMNGADGDSFDAIVAAGERSAFPHARPTDRPINIGELLKLDFGCTVNGMKSDMTRTVAVGTIPDECRKIYDIVLEAQKRALNAVKSGVGAKEVDSVARDYIAEMGYGSNFGHGLGHGLGYDIHEKPALNQLSEYVLEENNIVTIEPGIYIEGLGGVRIEDDIVVTKSGCEILNKSPKELITL